MTQLSKTGIKVVIEATDDPRFSLIRNADSPPGTGFKVHNLGTCDQDCISCADFKEAVRMSAKDIAAAIDKQVVEHVFNSACSGGNDW